MRFDDRLATVLRFDPGTPLGRAAIWRQMLDMLAQSGHVMTEAAVARGLTALSLLRDRVQLDIRIASSRSVAARCRSTALAVFLAHDVPAVAVSFIDRLILDEADWLTILPDIGPLGRSRLRERSDLPPAVARALTAFGSTDFALGAPLGAPTNALLNAAPASSIVTESDDVEANGTPEPALAVPSQPAVPVHNQAAGAAAPPSDIASLVQRIEAYRTHRASNDAAPLLLDTDSTPHSLIDNIAFRTDGDGHIRAITGAQRSAYVGLCLAETARAAESGFDAGVARAFGKRAPIRSGRLWLTGEGLSSGHWLLDADPKFDRLTGRFQGYIGTLCRPMSALDDSMAHNDGQPLNATTGDTVEGDLPQPRRVAEGMRQMVHELRSPLNAINGFAELIEGQFFGPVSQHYRQLARAIIGDAAQLAGTFDDFDVAARLDMGVMSIEEGQSDIVASIHAALSHLSTYLAASGSSVEIDGMEQVVIALPISDAKRIITRFVGAVAHHLGDKARIMGRVMRDDRLGRALLILDVTGDAQNVAVTANNQGDGQGDVIGIDFTLRLIDRMARMYGGSLDRKVDQFILNLPLLSSDTDRIDTAV